MLAILPKKTTLAAKVAAATIPQIIPIENALNAKLQKAKVSKRFQAHYTNLKGDNYGVKGLITEYLTKKQAIFQAGSENTALRPVVIAASAFSNELIEYVRSKFPRHPAATTKQNLSIEMTREGTIGKFRLTNAEDSARICPAPRCKYYLTIKS